MDGASPHLFLGQFKYVLGYILYNAEQSNACDDATLAGSLELYMRLLALRSNLSVIVVCEHLILESM